MGCFHKQDFWKRKQNCLMKKLLPEGGGVLLGYIMMTLFFFFCRMNSLKKQKMKFWMKSLV